MLKLTLIFTVTILFIFCTNFSSAYVPSHLRKKIPNSYHGNRSREIIYDYFVLAQGWPQTNCWSLNRQWQKSKDTCTICKMPTHLNEWSIHGLWPSSRFGRHPYFCSKDHFDSSLLSNTLLTQLRHKWASYKINRKDDVFWGYEYGKHGTCAIDNKNTDTMAKYFSKSLELLDNHNIGNILSKAKIFPDKSYEFNNIYQAIHRELGVNAIIRCDTNPMNDEQYIIEVNVCFDKSFKLLNCSDTKKPRTNCRQNRKLIYPKMLRTC